MCDRAAHARVDLRVDRARVEQPLDEPDRGAVGERLELGGAERRARAQRLEHAGLGQPRRRGRRRASARSSRRSQPFARASALRGSRIARSHEPARAPAAARARSARPRSARRAPESGRRRVQRATSSGSEHRADVLPERARLARRAVVGRRLAYEVEPARRRGCTPCRRGSGRATPDRASPAGRGRRARGARSSSRNGELCVRCGKTPSSRPSTNTTCERRVRARWRSTIATWPGARGAGAYRRALDRAEELLGREIAAELAPALELVEQRGAAPGRRAGRAGRPRLRAARRARGRRAASTRPARATPAIEECAAAQALEGRDRPAAKLHDLRLEPLRRADAAPAQAPLDEVGVGAPEPGVRGADEAEQVSAAAAEPRDSGAARGAQCPNGVCGDPQRGVERVRDRRARRMPTRAARARGRATGRRRGSRRERCRRAGARGSRPRRARASRACRRPRGSESRPRLRAPAAGRPGRARARGGRARDARSRRSRAAAPRAARRRGRARSAAVRSSDDEDGPPRLVLERHRHVHPAGERLEQPPLRRAQVLEPVRVDGPAVPGGEVAGEPLGRVRGGAGRGPTARAGRARRGSGVELGEIAVELVGVEQAGLELGDRRAERVGEPGEASRAAELVELRRRRRRGAGRARAARPPATGRAPPFPDAIRSKTSSKVPIVPPISAPQRVEQVALDPFDVRPVGTIRTGSRSMSARYRSRRSATLPAFAGPARASRPSTHGSPGSRRSFVRARRRFAERAGIGAAAARAEKRNRCQHACGARSDTRCSYWLFFGLRPRRACFVPFAARSATSPALTSSTT